MLAADLAMFADWYVPHATGASARPFRGRIVHGRLGQRSSPGCASAEQSWVLFDMQSPNLFWLPERAGIARIGLIDFQDMFVGPAAYDVATLCQDARVTIPPELEAALRDRYVAPRRAPGPARSTRTRSPRAYAILAAARTLKNMGVFARLADHLGKTQYLQHLPRMADYLARSLTASGSIRSCRLV